MKIMREIIDDLNQKLEQRFNTPKAERGWGVYDTTTVSRTHQVESLLYSVLTSMNMAHLYIHTRSSSVDIAEAITLKVNRKRNPETGILEIRSVSVYAGEQHLDKTPQQLDSEHRMKLRAELDKQNQEAEAEKAELRRWLAEHNLTPSEAWSKQWLLRKWAFTLHEEDEAARKAIQKGE